MHTVQKMLARDIPEAREGTCMPNIAADVYKTMLMRYMDHRAEDLADGIFTYKALCKSCHNYGHLYCFLYLSECVLLHIRF